MMRTILYMSLILAALAMKDSNLNQVNFQLQDLPKELMSSKIGQAILRFAQLKSQVQDVDFSKLFNAMDDLNASLQDNTVQENNLYESDYQQYLVDYDFYGALVSQHNTEVAELEVGVEDLTQSRAEMEQTLRVKNSDLGDVKSLRSTLVSSMTRSASEYEGHTRGYDNAIAIVDQATAIMTQVLQDSASVLLQNGEQVGNLLQKGMSAITHKMFIYDPIVSVLLSMEQTGFKDQRLVKSVIKLLNSLRSDIVGSKLSLVNSFELDSNTNNDLLEQLNARVAEVEEIIQEVKQDIETKNGQLSAKQDLLKDASENLDAAQENLNFTESQWTERQVQHKELIASYEHERLVLSQAAEALERGGIRRQ